MGRQEFIVYIDTVEPPARLKEENQLMKRINEFRMKEIETSGY